MLRHQSPRRTKPRPRSTGLIEPSGPRGIEVIKIPPAKPKGECLLGAVRAHRPDRGHRPDADLQRTPPAARPSPVRGPLQRPTPQRGRRLHPRHPITLFADLSRCGSSADPSSAASSTTMSGPRRSPGHHSGRVLEPHKVKNRSCVASVSFATLSEYKRNLQETQKRSAPKKSPPFSFMCTTLTLTRTATSGEGCKGRRLQGSIKACLGT